MKNSVFALPSLFVLGMLSFNQAVLANPVAETSQAAFDKEVLSSDKPVVVDFFATWCGPCQRLAPVIDKLSDQYTGKASFLRVDVDKNPALASKYKINGIPAIFIFKGGKVVDTSVGLVPQEVLGKKIDAVVSAKP